MGAVINALLVVIGSALGLVFKKGISDRIGQAIQAGIGLVVFMLGIQGALQGKQMIVTIAAIALGVLIGEGLDLDGMINRAIRYLEHRLSGGGNSQLAEGFIAASSLFCVGSMVIIGALENGLEGDPTTLITKGILDGISAIFLTSSYGLGVMVSAVAVLVLEGAMIILASFLAPFLAPAVINEMVATGSLLLIALGLNMMGIGKFKVLNYSPAMVVTLVLMSLLTYLGFL